MSFPLPCPSLIAIDAISNALTAQQCGSRELFGLSQSGCRGKLEGLRDATHEPACRFDHNLGFLEMLSHMCGTASAPSGLATPQPA